MLTTAKRPQDYRSGETALNLTVICIHKVEGLLAPRGKWTVKDSDR